MSDPARPSEAPGPATPPEDTAAAPDAIAVPEVPPVADLPAPVAPEAPLPVTEAPLPATEAPLPAAEVPAPTDAPPSSPGWAVPPDGAAPVPGAVPGWVPPESTSRSGRTVGCLVGCAIAAVVLVGLTVGGLIFLGSQVQRSLAGTVTFGSGGTECAVTGQAGSFPSSQTVHVVAYFKRQLRAGETVTLTVTYPDGRPETADESITGPTDCLYFDMGPGLDPGTYTFAFSAGSEPASSGSLEITP